MKKLCIIFFFAGMILVSIAGFTGEYYHWSGTKPLGYIALVFIVLAISCMPKLD